MRRSAPLAGAALWLLAAAPAPVALTLSAPPGGQPHLPVTVKGQSFDIRVALSFDLALILNQPAAERAQLKSFPLIGKRTFKNAMIPGGEATFRFNLVKTFPRGLPERRIPTVWVTRPVAGDADGIISVGALKTDRVEVILGPDRPGSRTYALTRQGEGDTAVTARVGDEKIDVRLELNSPDTVMNARAAAALVQAGVVRRVKEVGYWTPFPGVSLPFQRLAPNPGAQIFGLPLRRMGARVSEAEARAIDAAARAGTSTAEDDADTITVTAKAKKKGRDPWILLGRDVLGDCSRIVFDRPGEKWLLTCAF